ncbi:TPA: hypothetical protein ONA95_004781 [Pseudomonas aeruginosa]|nr:hypothetical protein [Pseudomonas aeruginosa]HBO4036376.1 hypothetical protein [Pseudomonas aeruginosa]HBO4112461.1 hypothetical protein [Pseudomonas aeruginosa]HCR1670295.1 hypothetical protein [Pseudomonas aeruginosa]
MNDLELLELAARAAGMNIQRSRLDDPLHRDFLMNGEGVRNPGQCSFPWNPLDDDGDALRLAVTLGLLVDICRDHTCVGSEMVDPILQDQGKEKGEATRRAIVRAAAEIGKSMGGGE